VRIVAVRVDPGVGAERNLHVRFIGPSGGGQYHRTDGDRFGGNLRRVEPRYFCLPGNIIAGDDGGHVPGAMLDHQLHIRVIHEGPMLDRVDTAEHGAANRLGAVSMCADDEPVVMCGRDDGAYLFQRELRVFAAAAFIENAARRHDLDRIVTLLVMLTHGFHSVIDAVDDPLHRRGIAGQVGAITVGVVCVTTRGADGLAGGVDPGTWNDAGIDGIAQRGGLVVM